MGRRRTGVQETEAIVDVSSRTPSLANLKEASLDSEFSGECEPFLKRLLAATKSLTRKADIVITSKELRSLSGGNLNYVDARLYSLITCLFGESTDKRSRLIRNGKRIVARADLYRDIEVVCKSCGQPRVTGWQHYIQIEFRKP